MFVLHTAAPITCIIVLLRLLNSVYALLRSTGGLMLVVIKNALALHIWVGRLIQ